MQHPAYRFNVSLPGRSGQLLLWNPWSNCGSPDLAYVEMGSFSPFTVLHAWLTGGGQLGFHLYWLLDDIQAAYLK